MTFSVSTFSAVFQKSDENHPQKEIVESSIIMISRVLCISILYLVLNSSMFYYSLDKAGATAKYCHILSMYGYSFTIVPVAEFIILFPISYLRYIILIMAGVISWFVVKKEIDEIAKTIKTQEDPLAKSAKSYGLISHAVWLILFKLMFI